MTLPTEMPDDSEDEDFDPAPQTSPSKRNRQTTRKTLPSQKKRKRKRGGSYMTDDEDEDGFSEEDSFSEVSQVEEESEGSVGGGRKRRRAATQKGVNYRVDDSDSGEFDEEKEPEIKKENENPRSKVNTSRQQLVVVLKLDPQKLLRVNTRSARKSTTISPESANKRQTRASSARATSQQPPHTPFGRRGSRTRQLSAEPSRKSSRLHPGEAPVFELTNSGRIHELPSHPSMVPEEPESSAEQAEPVKDVDMVESDDHDGKVQGQDEEADGDSVFGDDKATGKKPAVVNIDEDDEDEEDVGVRRRSRRTQAKAQTPEPEPEMDNTRRRLTRAASKAESTKKKSSADDDEEYQEEGEEEHSGSGSEASESVGTSRGSQRRNKRAEEDPDDYNPGKNSRRSPRKNRVQSEEIDEEEVADELEEILDDQAEMGRGKKRRSRRREKETDTQLEGRLRARKSINYNIIPQFNPMGLDDPFSAVQDPSQGPSSSNASKHFNLFQTAGPFGGLTEGRGVLGATSGFGRIGLAAGADSDSSDDEAIRSKRPSGFTVTSPTMTHNQVGGAGNLGNPTDMGKVRPKGALTTDSDPLGVDANISFDSVGGLDDHINQLKDMVFLPLMYPELFLKFGTSPPKGVLFHGPPGTGKTLLARALAASCSTDGRKITFFMRKGADVMSKWVGEAERQLRMLFEEAKNCQPSIIFFDEIDGLAPVRSSKQEQIHASIVATLLALMDGMDGRGQIIVIGATNRPDSVDPALRRPGRFDREFYFPLPNKEARRSIINIHTKKWDPPLSDYFKDKLAELTKGYGGADLRALCTEAALNAIQRRYPQIYQSKEKLLLNLDDIEVTARDFMISLKKMIPSSERATSSAGSLLPEHIKPLLEPSVNKINALLDKVIPKQKKLSVLEEAMYEDDVDPETGFMKEMMLRQFESGRIFRPRLLIYGEQGMGQAYIGAAVLQHFEGFFVQSFDLASLMGDTASVSTLLDGWWAVG